MNIDAPLKTQVPQLRALWMEAFGDTEAFLDTFFQNAFSTDRCRCITIDNSVVAALYWFDCSYDTHKVAYVYAVATAKAHRGQGLSHKLMENTHTHLQSLGYEGVILVPGSESLFRFYAGMGYEICSYIREFHCAGGNKNASSFIQEIDKTEYALLRPRFLPAGSVIQENENLDFLETMTKFYVGDHFLLAASSHENTLFATELLGDSSYAPEIVQALGYNEGTFRTPGTQRAFAMYFPLTKNKTAPKYFGFAFD